MVCWVFAGVSFWAAAGVLGVLAVVHVVQAVHRGRRGAGLGRNQIGQPAG